MKNLKRRINLILFSVIIGLFIFCGEKYIIYNYIYPTVYVAKIDCPSYGNKTIIKLLQQFNRMGDYKIVKYKPNKFWNRPLTIKEIPKIRYKPNYFKHGDVTIGLAEINLRKSVILLRSGMPYNELRHVLFHEYLHIEGYGHVKKPGDLMNPYYNYYDSEANIEHYAKDLEKRE